MDLGRSVLFSSQPDFYEKARQDAGNFPARLGRSYPAHSQTMVMQRERFQGAGGVHR